MYTFSRKFSENHLFFLGRLLLLLLLLLLLNMVTTYSNNDRLRNPNHNTLFNNIRLWSLLPCITNCRTTVLKSLVSKNMASNPSIFFPPQGDLPYPHCNLLLHLPSYCTISFALLHNSHACLSVSGKVLRKVTDVSPPMEEKV